MPQVVNTPPPAAYSRGPAWNNTLVVPPAPQTALLPPGPSCQPCPDCGGLECLCRPRFFAGQLLTEQDLNRLEGYIIAKNQLHNRYLVGHGVVCGLEVRCSPCANTVSVSTGYAIDTCGNDIIVCSADTVDICKLIRACTPTNQVNCAPYKDGSQCQDLEVDWILAIRYQETPSRGITPLTGPSQCSCGAPTGSCSCGSAVSKACGCGSLLPAASCCGQTVSATSPASTNLPRRGAPPACEPTVTCEAYRYEVFLAPTPSKPQMPPVRGIASFAGLIGGEFLQRIACCVQRLMATLPSAPTSTDLTQPATRTAWSNFCCNLRQALIEYALAQGGTDCRAIAKLRSISCPSPDSQTFSTDLAVAIDADILMLIEALLGCFCFAALPPCPAPGDPRVPLASVRVRASDCAIISVCDWTPLRKHVVTTKTLGYWLGWLPYVPLIRQFMQRVCCAILGLPEQLGRQFFMSTVAQSASAPVAGAAAGAAAASAAAGIAAGPGTGASQPPGFDSPISFGTQSYTASNPLSEAIVTNLAGGTNPISVADLMEALLGMVDPSLPAEKLAVTAQVKVLAEIARPLISGLAPLFRAATGSAQSQGADTSGQVNAMRAELETLKATVTTQQAALEALRTNAARPPPQ